MSISEGRLRLSILEKQLQNQSYEGFDMCKGMTVALLEFSGRGKRGRPQRWLKGVDEEDTERGLI